MCDVQDSSTNVLDKGYKVVAACSLAKPSQTVCGGCWWGVVGMFLQYPMYCLNFFVLNSIWWGAWHNVYEKKKSCCGWSFSVEMSMQQGVPHTQVWHEQPSPGKPFDVSRCYGCHLVCRQKPHDYINPLEKCVKWVRNNGNHTETDLLRRTLLC